MKLTSLCVIFKQKFADRFKPWLASVGIKFARLNMGRTNSDGAST